MILGRCSVRGCVYNDAGKCRECGDVVSGPMIPIVYCVRCGLPADPRTHRTYDGLGECCASVVFRAAFWVGRREECIERLWRVM